MISSIHKLSTTWWNLVFLTLFYIDMIVNIYINNKRTKSVLPVDNFLKSDKNQKYPADLINPL